MVKTYSDPRLAPTRMVARLASQVARHPSMGPLTRAQVRNLANWRRKLAAETGGE